LRVEYPAAGTGVRSGGAKGGHALNPRGEFYTTETIQEQLDRFLARQGKDRMPDGG